MVQMQSYLNVADNSGAKKVQCIKVLGGTHRYVAGIGDIIVVAVKQSLPNGAIKKGDVMKAVIVRTKKEYRRPDGTYISSMITHVLLSMPTITRVVNVSSDL